MLKRRQASEFVGREEYLTLFRRNLHLPPDDDRRRFIFSVHGQGGVGKTTLIGQFQEAAQSSGALTATVDEVAGSEVEAMGLVAGQFRAQGHPLKALEERYRVYRQRIQELEADPALPPGVPGLVGKTIARTALKLSRLTPAGAFTELLDEDAVSSHVGELTSFIARKLSNKDEVQLVLRPIQALTPLLLEGLREAAETRPAALFLDNYERTGDMLDAWLRDILEGRYGDLPANIVVVVAGRRELDRNLWSAFSSLIVYVPLNPFSEVETRAYLAGKGITNEQVVEMIVRLSGRLPLLVAMLATHSPADPREVVDPGASAVDRFLKWIDDPARRRAALNAALPRALNKDILAEVVEDADADGAFEWLRSMPFVEERGGQWRYHPVVRESMLRSKRHQSPQEWAVTHGRLAEHFDKRRAELGLDGEAGQNNSRWRELSLDVLYHRLCQNPLRHRPEALDGFTSALDANTEYALQWAETIYQSGQDASDAVLARWGERLVDGLKAHNERQYPENERLFTGLLESGELSDHSRAVALNWRAIGYRMLTRYPDAMTDLNQAIELRPGYALAIAQRGVIYRLLSRHDDALSDLNRSLELDPAHPWAIANRGLLYAALERYEDALVDMNRAIELNPNYTWAIAQRGRMHRLMQRYDQAMADFDRALAINPELGWVWANRAHLLFTLGRYEDALDDIGRAIEINPVDAWSLSVRGQVHQALDRPEEALADFNRAAELAPAEARYMALRGDFFQKLGRLQEALADLSRAIELDPKHVWAIGRRGHIYRLLGQHARASSDFDRVLTLQPTADWYQYERCLIFLSDGHSDKAQEELSSAIRIAQERLESEPANWRNTLNLSVYRLAVGEPGEAERLCQRAIAGGASREHLRAAIDDLDDFSKFFPDDTQAQALRGLLQSARERRLAV